MNIYKISNNVILVILSTFLPFAANAQKQPQIQKVNVRAPVKIKIDGQLTEWTNKFLYAYNSTDRIYYVVSNDDDNLYLTMRGLGTGAALKALKEGITFTISHSVDRKNRKRALDNVSVTFPILLDGKTIAYIMGPLYNSINFLKDTITNRKQIDSLVSISNQRINNAIKFIRIVGVKDIPDPVMSVYNVMGIKVAVQFINIQPVFELAIPLKYLGLSINNPVKFSYNIKLNGPPLEPNSDSEIGMTPSPDVLYMESTGDFWGTYTLVKK